MLAVYRVINKCASRTVLLQKQPLQSRGLSRTTDAYHRMSHITLHLKISNIIVLSFQEEIATPDSLAASEGLQVLS